MMGALTGLLFTAAYAVGGLFIIRCLLPEKAMLTRLWLGMTLGIALQMWLPYLCAYLFRFSLAAHLISLLPLCLLCGAAFLARDRQSAKPFDEKDKKNLILLVCVALPLTVIGGYLQWTHNICPAEDGSLHVGQSTYGDLNLHLGIITSMRDAAVPADYSIFPGERLSYPFLTDTFSTGLMLFGGSLRFSVVFAGIYMMALTFSGYILLVRRMASRSRVAVLAALLFFINGGLGFIYSFDMTGVSLGSRGYNELKMGTGLLERLKTILYGWYQTPANHAEFTTYNLRWSNVIVDMLIPQRTILGGWCQLLPLLYLLYDFAENGRFDEGELTESIYSHSVTGASLRLPVLMGIWAGMLPMIHTHSFLALGLVSAGWLVYDTIFGTKNRTGRLTRWGIYGMAAVLLAVPQLLTWTFSQASGSDHFLTFQFNWVNNSGGNGMRDMYLWFYIKNIGIPFLLILIALFEKDKKTRFLACGAFAIFIPAELIRFQPNEYDNNKLFYVWFMLCAVIAAEYAFRLFDRLKGLRGRYVIAVLTLFVFFCTGTLSICAECLNDYQTFSAEDVRAAEYIEQNTDREDVFLTWTEHINPVSSLAGRTIVCGPSLWLYWHGFDISGREAEIRAFYADPAGHADVLEKYNVQYIYVGSWERAELYINTDALDQMFETVYEAEYEWGTPEITIYKVP